MSCGKNCFFDLIRRPKWLLTLASIVVILCLPHVAQAADEAAKVFDVPAGPAEQTLRIFSDQAGIAAMYPSETVRGVETKAVKGNLTAKEALNRMLAETPLVGVQDPATGSLTVVREASNEKAAKNVKGAIVESSGRPKADLLRTDPVDENGEKVTKLDTFEVFGKKTLNMDIPRTTNDPQPHYILDSRQIERSGAVNVEDFLKMYLTMNTTIQAASQAYGFVQGNTSAINLRGLGANETLILVDGRRSAGVTATGTIVQPDVNGIPLSAIDHIEVLPSSASAIYGGAAMGGVVNIILKRAYSGGQFTYTYRTPLGSSGSQQIIDATGGATTREGQTNILVSVHYAEGKPLTLGDRFDLIGGYIKTILNNRSSYIYRNGVFPGATPNISSTNNSSLVLDDGTVLNSPMTHIAPNTSPGASLSSSLIANSGTYNMNFANGTGQFGLQNDLGVATREKSVVANVRHELMRNLELFSEFSYQGNYSYQVLNPFSNTTYNVPSTAPTSPFQQTIKINIPSALSVPSWVESDTKRVALGLVAELPRGWKLETDYTWSENSFRSKNFTDDSTSLNADLASGAVNPFVDTIKYPLDLTHYLAPATFRVHSTLSDVTLRAAGMMQLPLIGGPAKITIGIEHRKEAHGTADSMTEYLLHPADSRITKIFPQSQSTDSLYLESTIPLLKKGKTIPLVYSMELQLAGRSELYDVRAGTYSAFLSPASLVPFNAPQGVLKVIKYTATTPTVGLKYEPTESLALRASYSEGFLPPTVTQLLPNPTLNASFGAVITDPVTGQTYSSYQIVRGGNPDLLPQRAVTRNVGMIWTPTADAFRGLRVNLEYYNITQPNFITIPTAQQVVNDPAYQNRVTRDPVTGLVSVVNLSNINALKYETAGWDIAVDFRKALEVGTVDFHFGETVVTKDKRQYAVGSSKLNYLGFPAEGGEGKYKANASISFERRAWSFSWSARYFGGYQIYGSRGSPTDIQGNFNGSFTTYVGPQGSSSVESQVYHDLFVSYTCSRKNAVGLGDFPGRILRSVTVTLGLKNVFNTKPPLDAFYAPYYYSPYGDARLRDLALTIKKAF